MLDKFYTLYSNKIRLLSLVKKFIEPGSLLLEPFAGQHYLVSKEFRWETNDIEPFAKNDYNVDFLQLHTGKRYDAIVTNPPFCLSLEEILNKSREFSDKIFMIGPAKWCRLKNLNTIMRLGWVLRTVLPTDNRFYDVEEDRTKVIHCHIYYLEYKPDEPQELFKLELPEGVSVTPKRGDVYIWNSSGKLGTRMETFSANTFTFNFKDKETIEKIDWEMFGEICLLYGKRTFYNMYAMNIAEFGFFLGLFLISTASGACSNSLPQDLPGNQQDASTIVPILLHQLRQREADSWQNWLQVLLSLRK